MANVASGEIGVWFGGREYIFRPSFQALASYGEPDELERMLVRLQDPVRDNPLPSACAILTRMCDDDIFDMIGYWEDRDGKLTRVNGALPNNDVIVLATKLFINGIIGDIETAKKFKGNGDSQRKFDPAEFAAAAMVHLGASQADAWNMTMPDFQRALAVKFPDSVRDVPTQEEYRATIDTVKSIRERAKNGG